MGMDILAHPCKFAGWSKLLVCYRTHELCLVGKSAGQSYQTRPNYLVNLGFLFATTGHGGQKQIIRISQVNHLLLFSDWWVNSNPRVWLEIILRGVECQTWKRYICWNCFQQELSRQIAWTIWSNGNCGWRSRQVSWWHKWWFGSQWTLYQNWPWGKLALLDVSLNSIISGSHGWGLRKCC